MWCVTLLYFLRLDLRLLASFDNPKAKANVLVVCGWSECFLKYSAIIRTLYEEGFSVHTYDHQSQGLSGRWLPDSQSTWVFTFDDYVHDFLYFTTRIITNDAKKLPVFVLAHSMGAFISAIGMSRYPSLINRAVLLTPMFRMKCGTKSMNYRFPVPPPVAYWVATLSAWAGLGTSRALGYNRETPFDKLALRTFTSDASQLHELEALRQKYPSIISSCVTNDWIRHSLKAQKDFAPLYSLVKTNCLVLQATKDYFVSSKPMAQFVKAAASAVLFTLPDTYHELLFEEERKRFVVEQQILAFFQQSSDDVHVVECIAPFVRHDPNGPSQALATLTDTVLKGVGILVGSMGIVTGLALLTGLRLRHVGSLLWR